MSLRQTIKKDPNMRKIFGQQEIKIIEKQLLGVPLRPSEKTRLSRDIRKKCEAIKQLTLFENQLNLKHGAEIKQDIANAKQEILKSEYKNKIKRIILFGSAIDNTLRLDSDIDIAVEFIKIEKKEAVKFRLDIMRYVSEKIDIQVFNTLPEKIKKEISEKGKVLWKKE